MEGVEEVAEGVVVEVGVGGMDKGAEGEKGAGVGEGDRCNLAEQAPAGSTQKPRDDWLAQDLQGTNSEKL